MFWRHGGQKTERGWYLDRKSWHIFTLERKGDTLPGDFSHRYLKLNFITMLILAIISSLLFVIFLPTIGFVAAGAAIAMAILSFVVQRVMYNFGLQICRAEAEVCKIARRIFCKRCKPDFDDHIEMIIKALFLLIFFLAGAASKTILGC